MSRKDPTEIKWHCITDWNNSVYGLQKHTSFEATFELRDASFLYLLGKITDSEGKELFRSGDISDLVTEEYQFWDPRNNLEQFIEAIAQQTVETEPAYLQTPYMGMSIEVKGPVANPKVFATTISMSLNFRILNLYQWQDSGHISISMLCHRDQLLLFARGLETDLQHLMNVRENRRTTKDCPPA